MANNDGFRVVGVQLLKQRAQGGLLGVGASVGGTTLYVKPAFVADADGMAVVVLAVSADHLYRATGLNGSVATNHEVAAATLPAVGAIPAVDVLMSL